MKVIDLTGKIFDKWTVLKRSENNGNGSSMWICRCDCGTERTVFGGHLRNGASTNCGCVRKVTLPSSVRIHGKTKSREYNIWCGIIDRCTRVNSKKFEYYGGRGITICDEWRSSFEKFYSDMGDCPSLDHSIDRIDVNGNYEHNNCRWATKEEQARNTRSRRNTHSGIRGVSWHTATKKWYVRIQHNKKSLAVGLFENKDDAIKARKEAEIKYWGKAST